MFTNKKFILILCIVALGLGALLYFMNPTPQKYGGDKTQPKPTETQNSIPPGAVMEDGTILE